MYVLNLPWRFQWNFFLMVEKSFRRITPLHHTLIFNWLKESTFIFYFSSRQQCLRLPPFSCLKYVLTSTCPKSRLLCGMMGPKGKRWKFWLGYTGYVPLLMWASEAPPISPLSDPRQISPCVRPPVAVFDECRWISTALITKTLHFTEFFFN